VKRLVAVI